ncbi:MAG: hypothetical protein D6714_15840 [Bacteroidetes bacterium]|nr:MAG: hypothetical protein D6714_15840 [Bacteroidota bacterium]
MGYLRTLDARKLHFSGATTGAENRVFTTAFPLSLSQKKGIFTETIATPDAGATPLKTAFKKRL